MKNTYYAFRHGQSRANVEGIIISDPTIGTVEYGLTEEGRRQVQASLAAATMFGADAILVSSDFRRARETAEIIREQLGAAPIAFDIRLRERFFGEWEGKVHANYSKAWKKDVFDPNREFNGAECSSAVRNRMWAVVQSLEDQYCGQTIVLVSHGDPLMLLQTAFNDLGPEHHRSLPYIETAGHRKLNA
jgi:probable phosphoglycerate mutase